MEDPWMNRILETGGGGGLGNDLHEWGFRGKRILEWRIGPNFDLFWGGENYQVKDIGCGSRCRLKSKKRMVNNPQGKNGSSFKGKSPKKGMKGRVRTLVETSQSKREMKILQEGGGFGVAR